MPRIYVEDGGEVTEYRAVNKADNAPIRRAAAPRRPTAPTAFGDEDLLRVQAAMLAHGYDYSVEEIRGMSASERREMTRGGDLDAAEKAILAREQGFKSVADFDKHYAESESEREYSPPTRSSQDPLAQGIRQLEFEAAADAARDPLGAIIDGAEAGRASRSRLDNARARAAKWGGAIRAGAKKYGPIAAAKYAALAQHVAQNRQAAPKRRRRRSTTGTRKTSGANVPKVRHIRK